MKLKKEIKPIIEIVSAVVLGCIIIPLGIIHNIIKPFYDYRKRPLGDRLKLVFFYYVNILFHLWSVAKRLLHLIAREIDILGNVTSGELIEDTVTHEEDTYFGNGKITISASIGHVEVDGKLNKFGKWISKVLNVAFNEKKHAEWSYEREILDVHTEENRVDEL
jgi:hypothetical protein